MRYCEVIRHAHVDAAFVADVLGAVPFDGEQLQVVEAKLLREMIAEGERFRPGRLGVRLVGIFRPGVKLVDVPNLDSVIGTLTEMQERCRR